MGPCPQNCACTICVSTPKLCSHARPLDMHMLLSQEGGGCFHYAATVVRNMTATNSPCMNGDGHMMLMPRHQPIRQCRTTPLVALSAITHGQSERDVPKLEFWVGSV